MTSPTLSWRTWRTSGAGACAHSRARQPAPARPDDPRGSFFVLECHDLDHTRHRPRSRRSRPTCACARAARATFLLESVDQGRLGRYSLVGCGDRLVSFEEAERLGEPVVGYLGYDHVAKLEPTVPLPDAGPELPESRFVVADIAPALRPRHRHRRGARTAIRRESRRRSLASPIPSPSRAAGHAETQPLPRPRRARARRRARAGAHPPRRRVPDRALAARRAATTVGSPLAVYRALRRVNPSPYLFLLELDELALVGSSPETLVKGEGDAREPQPDRRHDRARRGRRRAPARVREGPRRARDARRPRPQRPLARLRARHREGRALPRAGALLAHHAPRLGGRRASCATGVTPFDLLRATFPAGTVSGAPKVRAMQIISELEGYRRGPYAGAVGYHVPGLGARHVHRDPHRRPARRPRATCRRAAGSSPTPTRPPSTRSACASSPRSRRRSMLRRHAHDPADRQLRLVHLQPRAPVRGAGRGGRRATQRRDHRTRRRSSPPPTSSSRRGPAGPRRQARRRTIVRRLSGRVPTLGVCLGHQAIVQVFGGEVGPARELVHGKATTSTHDGRGIFAGLPEDFLAGPLPLARRDVGARRARGLGDRRRRRGDGRAPPRAAGRRRAVPPRVGADARSAATSRGTSSRTDDPGRARAAARRPGPLARRVARA